MPVRAWFSCSPSEHLAVYHREQYMHACNVQQPFRLSASAEGERSFAALTHTTTYARLHVLYRPRALEQMSVHQRIELTVLPEYGYGMNGYPPIVPANATLIYEIELLAFSAP